LQGNPPHPAADVEQLVDPAQGVVENAGLQKLGGELEVGYWVARDLWGRGYAPEEKIGMTFQRETTGAELGHRMPEIEVVLYRIERAEWEAQRAASP
jgi:hypothetical protein